MQLGTCSWTLGLKDLEQLMSKVKSLGLDGLHFCEKLTDYSPIDVKETAERYGLKIFAIDPFYAKPENSSEATLPNAISYYSEVIDFAVEANSHGLPCKLYQNGRLIALLKLKNIRF